MNAKNIFGAFAVAIALFFLWPGVFNSWAEVRALQTARAEHDTVLTERTALLEKTKKEYAAYQKILQSPEGRNFASLVPTKKGSAEIVSATQAIAGNSGLQVAKMEMSESKTQGSDQYATVTLSLVMSGSYSGLKSFLESLEQYVRILNVKSILIAQSKQEGTLNFFIQTDTYYSK